MKLLVAWPAVAAGLFALILSGCVITETTYVRDDRRPYPPPRTVVVEQPQPAVVVAQPQPAVIVAQPQPVVIVHRPVPPLLVEQVPPPPAPGVIWVQGYWAASGDQWIWVRGHYDRPPRQGAVWVAPRYESVGAEVHFSAGGWR